MESDYWGQEDKCFQRWRPVCLGGQRVRTWRSSALWQCRVTIARRPFWPFFRQDNFRISSCWALVSFLWGLMVVTRASLLFLMTLCRRLILQMKRLCAIVEYAYLGDTCIIDQWSVFCVPASNYRFIPCAKLLYVLTVYGLWVGSFWIPSLPSQMTFLWCSWLCLAHSRNWSCMPGSICLTTDSTLPFAYFQSIIYEPILTFHATISQTFSWPSLIVKNGTRPSPPSPPQATVEFLLSRVWIFGKCDIIHYSSASHTGTIPILYALRAGRVWGLPVVQCDFFLGVEQKITLWLVTYP